MVVVVMVEAVMMVLCISHTYTYLFKCESGFVVVCCFFPKFITWTKPYSISGRLFQRKKDTRNEEKQQNHSHTFYRNVVNVLAAI